MLEKMEERGEIIEKVTDQRLMDFKVDGGRGRIQANMGGLNWRVVYPFRLKQYILTTE